jgi:hypothetical protein
MLSVALRLLFDIKNGNKDLIIQDDQVAIVPLKLYLHPCLSNGVLLEKPTIPVSLNLVDMSSPCLPFQWDAECTDT